MKSNSTNVTVVRYLGTNIKRTKQVDAIVAQTIAMQRRGFDVVTVLSEPPEKPEWKSRLDYECVTIEYIPRPRYAFDLRCIRDAVRLFRKYRPKIVHCDNIHIVPLIAARLTGVSGTIWHKRAMNSASEKLRPKTMRDWLVPRTRITTALTQRVICVSDLVADELEELGISRKKLTVLHNPGKIEYEHRKAVDLNLRQPLGLHRDDVVIVAVGHAVPVKGWDDLLEAFSRIGGDREKTKLCLVGSYSDAHEKVTYERLRRIIAEYDIGDRVTFLGEVDNVDAILRTADIFVLSSRAEGFSNALIEAFLVGVPCVSTRVGIAPRLIVDGESGCLVERGDVGALAEALERLSSDHAFRDRIRTNAVRPSWLLSHREHSERVADIYRDVVSETAG